METLNPAPTVPLVAGLLALMYAANEVGFRIGRGQQRREPETSWAVGNAFKASVMGLVALLLGFSFSMTAGRHDMRSKVVLEEANAIGTCNLRAGLLDDPARTQIREVLRKYVSVRLEYFDQALDPDEASRTTREMDRLLNELWTAVESAHRSNPQAILTSQIVPAANTVIDQSGTRAWAVRNRVPGPVFALLLVCVLVSSLLMGHSSGQAGKRHMGLWVALNVLLAMVLFVVFDFDRPRRGLIRVDHTPLIELRASLEPLAP